MAERPGARDRVAWATDAPRRPDRRPSAGIAVDDRARDRLGAVAGERRSPRPAEDDPDVDPTAGTGRDPDVAVAAGSASGRRGRRPDRDRGGGRSGRSAGASRTGAGDAGGAGDRPSAGRRRRRRPMPGVSPWRHRRRATVSVARREVGVDDRRARPDVGAARTGEVEQRRIEPRSDRTRRPDRPAAIGAVGQAERRARRRLDAHRRDRPGDRSEQRRRRARRRGAPRPRRATRRRRPPASARRARAPGRRPRVPRPASRAARHGAGRPAADDRDLDPLAGGHGSPAPCGSSCPSVSSTPAEPRRRRSRSAGRTRRGRS